MLALGRLLFCLQFVLLDFVEHRVRPPAALAIYASASAALMLLCLLRYRASGRLVERLLLPLLLAAVFVCQAVALRYYRAPLDAQSITSAWNAWGDVRPMLAAAIPQLMLAVVAVACLQRWALRALIKPEPAKATLPALGSRWLAPALLTISLTPLPLGLAQSTPEYRLLGASIALGSLLHSAVNKRTAPLTSHTSLKTEKKQITRVDKSEKSSVPDVLFILTESVRASDYCLADETPCLVAPKVHALLPQRVSLESFRSVASYTTISINALLTGKPQIGSRDELTQPTTLFEWLRHATVGGQRVHLSYYSAQLATIFERPLDEQPLDQVVTLEPLLGRVVADEDDVVDLHVDARLVDRFVADVPQIPQLSFTWLHFAGTHAPYFVDPKNAPFQPYSRTPAWSTLGDLHRAYQNAILAQDAEIARAIEAFIGSRGGRPWLIFFTSDHGEAFGEHQAIHHGQNVYPEQIHVPGFVAWSEGALSGTEELHLRQNRTLPLTHLDVLPSWLDLYGIHHADDTGRQTAAESARTRFPGRSIFAVPPHSQTILPAIPLTNCSASFLCPLSNWGMLSSERLLVAQPWDQDFHCLNLAGDELGRDPACDALQRASLAVFPLLPSGTKNRPR